MNPDPTGTAQQSAPDFLPHDAQQLCVDDVAGWHYVLYDPYGRRFAFFIWQNERGHQVSLVDPPLEGLPQAARLHIDYDGRIRPGDSDGSLSMAGAFANSVVWVAYRAVREALGELVMDLHMANPAEACTRGPTRGDSDDHDSR